MAAVAVPGSSVLFPSRCVARAVLACVRLKGMFAAASMSGNLLAIQSETVAGTTAASKLNGATFVDACAKLGDAASRLTAVAMHSANPKENHGETAATKPAE